MPVNTPTEGGRRAVPTIMVGMPAIPASTKTSLAQRLRAHAKRNWPQLTAVHVRYRTSFATSTVN